MNKISILIGATTRYFLWLAVLYFIFTLSACGLDIPRPIPNAIPEPTAPPIPTNTAEIISTQSREGVLDSTATVTPAPTSSSTPIPTRTLAPPASATPVPVPQVKVIFSSINVRSGPGEEHFAIRYLFEGDIVEVVDTNEDGSWNLVLLEDGVTGWVDADVVEVVGRIDLATVIDLPTPTSTPISVTLKEGPTYEIVDISFDDIIRFSLYLTTLFPINIPEIHDLCDEVVDSFKTRQEFNAVTVFISDHILGYSYGFSIASCTYAPDGDWAAADTIQTGDYSRHLFTYVYQPKVRDPETVLSHRPNEQEYALCYEWEIAKENLIESGIQSNESEVLANQRVMDAFGITPQELDRILLKCASWMVR